MEKIKKTFQVGKSSTSNDQNTDSEMSSTSSALGEQKPPAGTMETDEASPRRWLISPDEYSGLGEQTVPLRSLFDFLPLEETPIYVGTLPHTKPISELLAKQVRDNAGATLQVNIEDSQFYCIPSLLKCYSMWFASRDWRATNFNFLPSQVPAKGFECAYEWLRFQKLPSTADVVYTLQVARYLKIDLLEPICWAVLNADSLREKAAFMVFRQAKPYPDLQDVCNAMSGRIRNYFLALVGSKYFTELSVDDLEYLLKRDSIGVNSEIEVFFLVLRWMNLARDERVKHLGRLMDCVRFSLMPIAFLWTLRDGFTHPDKDHLFSADPMLQAFNMDPKTETIITDAMSYVATADSFLGDYDSYLDHMKEHRLPVTYPRKNVYHHHCPYHKYVLGVSDVELNFKANDFEQYIGCLQELWKGDGPPSHGDELVVDAQQEAMGPLRQ
ncbi:uncharacterized protein LOC111080280 [Drosophila obscura]|uniref:uncharacterized protein LOC111080280 n=1 Tax=Drosophila obscura TaxID=7282 RepID=UPI001BB2C843|nr:uncharacterized protein LOC111080280 [Drosophila obscura]